MVPARDLPQLVGPLSDRDVAEFFDEPQASQYEESLGALWLELVRARTSLAIAETVASFPQDFIDPTREEWLSLLWRNFADAALLRVVAAVRDRHDASLTVASLRKWMVQSCRDDARKELEKHLAPPSLGEKANALVKKAWDLRRKLVAHLDRQYATDPLKARSVALGLSDLVELRDRAEALLAPLCIGSARAMEPPGFSGALEEALGELLECSSHLLRMPEEQPDSWAHYARGWDQKAQALFNQWRRRTGRPQVSFP